MSRFLINLYLSFTDKTTSGFKSETALLSVIVALRLSTHPAGSGCCFWHS